MAYHTSTLQRTASCYGSISVLDGVPFKVGEKFKPPKKVTLPVGWHKNDPSDVLSRTYDFNLEKYVLAICQEEQEARELEESQQREKEALEAAVASSTSTVPATQAERKTNTPPIFANVSADILTPVTVGATSNSTSQMEAARSDHFNLKDFEGDSMTPFELVELQSINNMDALKSLLQPELESTAVTQTSPVPAASVGSNTVVSTSPHQQLIDIHSESSYITNPPQKSPSPVSNQVPPHTMASALPGHVPPATCAGPGVEVPKTRSTPTVSYTTRENNVLIDVRDNKALTQSTPLDTVNPIPRQLIGVLPGAVITRPTQLPPIGGAGTRVPPPRPNPPQVPPRIYKNSTDNQKNLAKTTREDLPQSVSPVSSRGSLGGGGLDRNHHGAPECSARGFSSPPLGGQKVENSGNTAHWTAGEDSGRRRTAERRTRLSDSIDGQGTGIPHRHSSPLPPIPNAANDTIGPEAPQSELPNPLPTMTSSQKSFVASISCMGFPEARVARAVLKLGETEKEVIDFLILVEEFSSNGYDGDSIEVALIEYNMDKEKALKFLKVVTVLSELGFKNEDIYEALKKTNIDTDKALDYLMTK